MNEVNEVYKTSFMNEVNKTKFLNEWTSEQYFSEVKSLVNEVNESFNEFLWTKWIKTKFKTEWTSEQKLLTRNNYKLSGADAREAEQVGKIAISGNLGKTRNANLAWSTLSSNPAFWWR